MDVFNNNKPEAIDTQQDDSIDAADSRVASQTDSRVEDFIKCCLCGSDLVFQHQVNYSSLAVREDAHCPACQIRLRSRDHILH
ncbi:MAG: hypothetical protein NDI61_06815 [Bdellovibrionaceae bacterium]|nr:hypothetical protein [Pseudobdellovibrionaceae bacterium]